MEEHAALGSAHALQVRPADSTDRDAVLAFVEPGDYLADVWEAWLHDARGVLLVGVLAGRPVAVFHVRLLTDDEAWLEGLRVDPAYRRQGIGRVMTSRALGSARALGAQVARLFAELRNDAARALFERFSFSHVADLLRFEAPPLDEPPTGMLPGTALRLARADDFERIWEQLEQSNLLPLTGGLEIDDWSARALSEPLLRAYLAAEDVALLEEWGTIQALAVAVPTPARAGAPGTLEVRYLDGLADAIGRTGVLLRRQAAERGLARVGLWLPDLLILRDAMDGAGFTRVTEAPMAVYERDLEPPA